MKKLNTSKEQIKFANHLKLEENKRIILSAPFGTGKTTFINDFSQNFIEEYNCTILRPINYSLGNNEDIFKYIKYDIVCNLLEKITEYNVENYTFTLKETFIEFIKDAKNHFDINEISSFIETIANLIPNSNIKSSLLSIKLLFGFYLKFKNFSSRFGKKGLENYKESTILSDKLYIENDLTSQLIQFLIQKSKEVNHKKELLVIDDLDRIDPEHIFRLLNVFSAHDDFNSSYKHKYEFDHVVIVCDINNIRNIFHAKYGLNTDFSGYIDKFYSKEIYYFKNPIEKNIKDLFLKITNLDPQNNNNISSILDKLNQELTSNGLLTFRKIDKLNLEKFNSVSLNFTTNNNKNGIRSINELPLCKIFSFYECIFPEYENFNFILNKLRKKSKIYSNLSFQILTLIDYKNLPQTRQINQLNIKELNCLIEYEVYFNKFNLIYKGKIIKIKNLENEEIRNHFPYIKLLSIAYTKFQELKRDSISFIM